VTATRVVVVAPEQLRSELVRALGSGRDVIVVGSTSAPADASGLIDHASPDVAVVDLSLPGGSAAA
jgi:DNA-binding NarL/FixJ family response regulator